VKKLFAVSGAVVRHDKKSPGILIEMMHDLVFIWAVSKAEAKGLVIDTFKEQYPERDGWAYHHLVALEAPEATRNA
jgi:hypothetical protein